jgi:hypothetical protein
MKKESLIIQLMDILCPGEDPDRKTIESQLWNMSEIKLVQMLTKYSKLIPCHAEI